MSTNRVWTSEESSILLGLCAQKCSDVNARMSLASISLEYKESSGSNRTTKSVEKKLRELVSSMFEMTTLDLHTKAKIAIVLLRPITEEFLQRVRQHADVEINEKRQIVKFKERKDGGISYDSTAERDVKMLEKLDKEKTMIDLLSKMSDASEVLTNACIIRKYREITNCTESESSIERLYNKVKSQIFKNTKFDMRTKIRMLYASKASISDEHLKELRKDGVVVLDSTKKSIKKYSSHDGTFILGEPIDDRDKRRQVDSEDSFESRIATMLVNDESGANSDFTLRNGQNTGNDDASPPSTNPPCFLEELEEKIGVKSVLQFLSEFSRSIKLPEGPNLASMEELLVEVENTYRTKKDKKILTSTILMLLYVELLKNVNSASVMPSATDEFVNLEKYLNIFLNSLRYIQSEEVEKYRAGLRNTFSTFERTKKMVPTADVISTVRTVLKFVVDYLKNDTAEKSEKSKKRGKNT
ncbi:hypothetical protein CRE_25742 [Caenorhabditis remanei]|uniref:SPK domain-containing protein n=1 Tax=Caenorhabditis remanei TaxID=31234 RepID=E3MLD7_CAERE|nr:hypothetical protein CRE_25742 [Caenorhabditis remanei]